MAYDPNDPLEMIKQEARDEFADVEAAARAMLAAITPILEAMDHHDGPQTVHMGKATVDALFAAYAQATAAGIDSPDKGA